MGWSRAPMAGEGVPEDINVVAEGDSLTAGTGSPGEIVWTDALATIRPGWTISNVANGGDHSFDVDPAEVDALWSGTADVNVCVLFIGTNDAANGWPTSGMVDNIEAFCDDLRALHAGWKILLISIPPRTDLTSGERNTYNAAHVTTASSADRYYDIDQTTGSSVSANPSYYSDGTHFSNEGAEALAADFAPEIEAAAIA